MFIVSYLKNPKTEIGKIARFLEKDLSDEIIQDIADKCSFKNLKHADATVKDKHMPQVSRLSEEDIEKRNKHGPTNFYRKGETFVLLLECSLKH